MFSENSLRPLFTFALNVSEQFLFSDGVIASRFRPSVVVGLLRDAVQELKRGHFEIMWLHQKLVDFLLRG